MKGKRFGEEQIIEIPKEAGLAVAELIRKYASSEQTYYCWKNKSGGMDLSDAKRLVAGQPLGHPDPRS